MNRKIWIFVIVGMLASMPVRIGGLNQPFPVYGYIKDSTGNAVANAPVYIKDMSKSTYMVVYTNEQGYYQANLYNLENCEDGDTINVSCSYNDEINYIIFVLDVTQTSKNVSFHLIGNPSVLDNGAYDITSSSAKIGVEITDLGGDTYCRVWIEYGTTESYGTITSKKTVNSPASISFSLTNLQSDTEYHYRIVAENSRKKIYLQDATFTTLASIPQVTTLSATSVGYSQAKLRGYLNSAGASWCLVWFVWDTSYHDDWQDYAHQTSYKNLTSSSSFSTTIYNLSINTTYHFRAVASNKAGISCGNDLTFTTHLVSPSVITMPATNLTSSEATLNGRVVDTGGSSSCQVWFEYGTTTSYGSTTPIMYANSTFSVSITNLQPGKTYHFRAVAKNKAGISYGNDLTFTTRTLKANVSTSPVDYAVVLNGEITDMGGSSSCQVWFEYGTTTSYGNTTSKKTVNSIGEFHAVLTGLESGVIYHYRAVVENENGITYGSDMTFTMLSLPSPPSIETMYGVVNVTGGIAKIYGNISSLNNNTYCYAWFEYWKDGEQKMTTPLRILYNEGIINESISVENATYFFRLVAVGANGVASYGDIHHFVVPKPANNRPGIVAVYPENGSVTGTNVSLIVNAWDRDGDEINITFYWGNGSIIGNFASYNGTYSVAVYNLSYGKNYSWYAVVSDGIETNSTPLMHFSTVGGVLANFTWQPYVAVEGETVYFYDNSTGANSWLWEFGDGNISNESNPSHIYKHGIYRVKLTVYGSNGISDSVEKELHVYMPGDVNMDDKINALDITSAEILIENQEYSKVADMDKNGILNENDIEKIIEAILGIK